MAKSSNLVPLLVLFVLVAVAAAVGFVAYSVATEVSDKAARRMEKKNIKFSKDGMKVGVKEISTEDISDTTQSYGSLSTSDISCAAQILCLKRLSTDPGV